VARKPESVTIRLFDNDETVEVYQILNVIEFTSARKRMSVIVRTPNGEIKIYVKVPFPFSPFSWNSYVPVSFISIPDNFVTCASIFVFVYTVISLLAL
jgi:Cation transport ATPase (P-type)